VARCTGKGWGFYGCSNSGLGGFFSLAMDSWAFSGELVWFASLLGEGKQSWEHFAHQPCGRSIRPSVSSLGCRSAVYNTFSGCRNDFAFHGGWDTHSSALGLRPNKKNLLNFHHVCSPFVRPLEMLLSWISSSCDLCGNWEAEGFPLSFFSSWNKFGPLHLLPSFPASLSFSHLFVMLPGPHELSLMHSF
jgi:hypothetical protein